MEHLSMAAIRTEHQDILAAALESMQKQMFLTDVMITCVDQEFAAHRVILSAGSPYFRTMFSNNMSESNSGKIEFKHVSPHSMQVLLEFLYTGHIWGGENDTEQVIDILSAAHRLQVKLLYDFCWNVLLENLSIGECFHLWELAELYEHKQALAVITQYTVENFVLVVASSEFLSLPAVKLETMLKHSLLKTSSDVLVKNLIEWAKHAEEDERKEKLMQLMDYVDFHSLSNEYISAAANDDFVKTFSSLLCKLLAVAVSRSQTPKKPVRCPKLILYLVLLSVVIFCALSFEGSIIPVAFISVGVVGSHITWGICKTKGFLKRGKKVSEKFTALETKGKQRLQHEMLAESTGGKDGNGQNQGEL